MFEIKLGEVVTFKKGYKNEKDQKIGILNQLYIGDENIILVVHLSIQKWLNDRPIQPPNPLKLYSQCDNTRG